MNLHKIIYIHRYKRDISTLVYPFSNIYLAIPSFHYIIRVNILSVKQIETNKQKMQKKKIIRKKILWMYSFYVIQT